MALVATEIKTPLDAKAVKAAEAVRIAALTTPLDKEATVVLGPVWEKKVGAVTRGTLIDDARKREARMFCKELGRWVILWSGDEYDAAGDYTEDGIRARATELIVSGPPPAR